MLRVLLVAVLGALIGALLFPWLQGVVGPLMDGPPAVVIAGGITAAVLLAVGWFFGWLLG
jgi:hypothetical protein